MASSPKSSQVGDFSPGSNESQSKVGVYTPTSGNRQSPVKLDVGSLIKLDARSSIKLDIGSCVVVMDDAYLSGIGDYPRTAFTTTLFTSKNFRRSKGDIINCLKAKEKLRYITGKNVQPPKYTRECGLWVKNDTMIVALIKILWLEK